MAIGSGAAAGATVLLFLVSRGKWSDAIIDSGREWIVPDALARGDLLYRDVVYWFGPFTPYFHALFFRAFGSSFRTLAIAGACGGAAVLACLHFALSRVTGRREAWAWTVAAIPLLVFMPNAGGAILGMGYRMWHAAGFSLLSIALAASAGTGEGKHRRILLASGALAGLAGLCRTEWGIAAAIAACVAALTAARGVRARVASTALLAAGFLAVEAVGIGLFAILAGPAAVFRDAPVLLLHLPPETTARIGGLASIPWLSGSTQMAYAALTLTAAFLALDLLVSARFEPGGVRPRLVRLVLIFLALAACVVIGGSPVGGMFSGAPLLCAAAVVLGFREAPRPLGAALAGFGTMGLLASHRRFFFLTDGPYVAPPLLFAVVCVAGGAAMAVAKRPIRVQGRLSAALLAAVAVLAAAAFAGRIAGYRSDDRVPVPGTDGMLSARPAVSRDIRDVSERIRRETAAGTTLVVFPEGEVLNFLTDRNNPIRHKLYLPGYVTASNEGDILRELARARPAAIVLWPRPLGEYGQGEFGAGYGSEIRSWIAREYALEKIGGALGHGPIVALRKAP